MDYENKINRYYGSCLSLFNTFLTNNALESFRM